ncbi:hypothetical protein EmuJ_000841100 [Echinococcus multilocularis]|uniref:Uncharacterized protein n=1 Tax=Echinococcus multilocularis TaxID=6211 RepID=A0A068YF14_ECHMU|nr:hypothetical protein EmuJ_000841100 [Echinococcus multilocularis]
MRPDKGPPPVGCEDEVYVLTEERRSPNARNRETETHESRSTPLFSPHVIWLFCDKQKKALTPLFTATTLTSKSEFVIEDHYILMR